MASCGKDNVTVVEERIVKDITTLETAVRELYRDMQWVLLWRNALGLMVDLELRWCVGDQMRFWLEDVEDPGLWTVLMDHLMEIYAAN